MKANRLLCLTIICQFLLILSSFAQPNENVEGPPFNFFFQDTMMPAGETDCMDVLVENFTEVGSFEFAFRFDGSKFKFVEITTSVLKSANLFASPPVNYDPNNPIVTVVFFDLAANGVSLDDDAVAFSLCFEATGVEGESSLIEISELLPNGNDSQIFNSAGDAFMIPEFNLVPAVLTIGDGGSPVECMDLCFEIGTTWIYDGNDITLNRDSVICGELWYGVSELGSCSGDLQNIFLRKEEGAIWMHDPASNISSILYDFTKQAGESWEIVFPNGAPSHTVVVDSVSTLDLGGRSVQVQHVGNGPFYDFSGEIYEGIGSSHYLFPTGNFCDGGPGVLICYSTEAEEVSIDMDRPCVPTSVGELSELNDLSIYPNPVQNQLYLETVEQKWNYQILNLQGQQVSQGVYHNNISLSQLPSGIYFLQLQREGELYKAIKFVKE